MSNRLRNGLNQGLWHQVHILQRRNFILNLLEIKCFGLAPFQWLKISLPKPKECFVPAGSKLKAR